MFDADVDRRVREAAFVFLGRERTRLGHADECYSWAALLRGFDFEGRRVPLVSQQGIFKPAVLPEIPISIRTTPPDPRKVRPYDDDLGDDGLLRYRYRGTDPGHPENRGLVLAMRRRVPLVYFHGVTKGRYAAFWPVHVVGADPRALTFTVAAADEFTLVGGASVSRDDLVDPDRRRYTTRQALHRLHQQDFRERVLRAYRERCAICSLRFRSLLEASHIVPDREPAGDAVVPNGLTLCRLHHGAYDRELLGISPDLEVRLAPEVLDEEDGPMLEHGLREFHGHRILVPRAPASRPDRDRLAWRYERFLSRPA